MSTNRHDYVELNDEDHITHPITQREKAAIWGVSAMGGASVGIGAGMGTYWLVTTPIGAAGSGAGVVVAGTATLIGAIVAVGFVSLALSAYVAYRSARSLLLEAEQLDKDIQKANEDTPTLMAELQGKMKRYQEKYKKAEKVCGASFATAQQTYHILSMPLQAELSDVYSNFTPPSKSDRHQLTIWKALAVFLGIFAGISGAAWGTSAVLMGAFAGLALATPIVGWLLLAGSALVALGACVAYAYYSDKNNKRILAREHIDAKNQHLVGQIKYYGVQIDRLTQCINANKQPGGSTAQASVGLGVDLVEQNVNNQVKENKLPEDPKLNQTETKKLTAEQTFDIEEDKSHQP